MPTVLYIKGWRFFFYANEGNEPIHIHIQKGEKECKFWLDIEKYSIEEAHTYNMNKKEMREVRKILLQNLDEIAEAWNQFFGGN
ncbi:DUF4160 domain-containing protein (plasmid) [Cyanobacterium sp. IPPAS B-1200]|uniref:DUF4160 domain-containing protein n=1 Tax=Cyanobacterium sp. IPPAS B-1200 TaxID=1562720 RepID=UPI0008525453|nr:DUF4160 domain-containing protein [Cyanobacterium sp. IPPAS B-1200]OEJ78418.1 hypothetical protein A5482_13305 [Cyanobacterium sp. IPPAS B-1200]